MIWDFFNRLIDELSTCPRCRKWGGSPFCPRCWSQVYPQMELRRRRLFKEFDVVSLFDWTQEEHSALVYALKGGWRRQTFNDLAWKFVAEELSTIKSKLGDRSNSGVKLNFVDAKDTVFIPAPPKKWTLGVDHAAVWAQELARVSGGNYLAAFCDRGFKYQRKMSWEARQELKLELLRGMDDRLNHYKRIVFVDDVVTTGATAQAAWRCIKGLKPKSFVVWSLAYRPLQSST